MLPGIIISILLSFVPWDGAREYPCFEPESQIFMYKESQRTWALEVWNLTWVLGQLTELLSRILAVSVAQLLLNACSIFYHALPWLGYSLCTMAFDARESIWCSYDLEDSLLLKAHLLKACWELPCCSRWQFKTQRLKIRTTGLFVAITDWNSTFRA